MEKARQIKEEVNMATSDLKQVVDKQNETFLNKTGNNRNIQVIIINVYRKINGGG